MTREQHADLRRLAKKYRIFFDGPLTQEHWPKTHVSLFQNIQLLGQKRYQDYKEARLDRPADDLWGAHILRRTDRVVQIAQRLRLEDPNEAGWRLHMEPEIFQRFTVEVACPECRARIWRSEIEAYIDKELGGRPSLEDRRKRREPCHCSPVSRQQDISDPGLNPLFSNRVEEFVYHDNDIQTELPKREYPDRVYGLRETKVFERALSAFIHPPSSPNSGPVQMREMIKSSPFRQGSDPLLFPFLILEAKSEKGPDSFNSIEQQTSFPIRTLLRLQEELQKQCSYKPAWQHGPTVWFLAYKGDEWRVSGAYVRAPGGGQSHEEISYRIIDLWQGRVVSKDGALQLLLILDHIFDWARDIYRLAILRHLRFLCAADPNDAISMTHDSDVFSMKYPVNGNTPSSTGSQLGFENFAIDDVDSTEFSDELGPMRLLESPEGLMRDAALVEYRFLSFIMTGDTARTILQSFLPHEATKFAGVLMSWLSSPDGLLIVNGETIDDLETMWTDELRHPHRLTSQKQYYARVTYKTWLTEDWVIVKELLCLAIATDAIDVLREASKQPYEPMINFRPATQDQVVGLIQPFKRCSPDYNLRAAVMRLALSSYLFFTIFEVMQKCSNHRFDGNWIPAKPCPRSEGVDTWFGLAEEMKGDKTQTIVYDIYKKHKIGRREPTETYIRRSTNTKFETFDNPESPYHYPLPGNRYIGNSSGSIVVVGTYPQRTSSIKRPPQVCLFIRSREKHQGRDIALVRSLLGNTLEVSLKRNRDVLTTFIYNPSRALTYVKWNIRQPVSKAMQGHQLTIRLWLDRLRREHGVDRFCKEIELDPLPCWNGNGNGPPFSNKGFTQANDAKEAYPNDPSSLRYRVLISDKWVDQ